MLNRLTIVLALTIATVGCGRNDISHTMNQYQERIANVLDAPFNAPIPIKASASLVYPSKRLLVNVINPPQLDVKQFFALKKCDLSVLIAQRNTPLGRIQPPSVRYLYEREVVESLSRCKLLMPEYSALLDDWLEHKLTALPLVWANLIQTSDETINAFSNNSDFFNSVSSTELHTTKSALSYLLDANSQLSSAPNSQELERYLSQLSKSHLPAKTWRTQSVIREELNSTTLWLQKQDLFEQCKDGQPSQKMKYLKNVFTLFFIEKIQPIGSELNRVHYTLSPLYQKLSTEPNLAPSFRQFINAQGDEGFNAYQLAMKHHVEFWQTIFKHCGISPRVN
ncbi:DUF3080 family protein [Paraglaciecola sp. T6c]|uniref:DUF3080 family protein n=1 Tax=Pseudoalteromonas atlantica (strain T6c / ATCC BAA-1087) TaxID=3042615 RepID=UPI000308F09A|nr:DUF3080 family protein [Paraglaciecola sp. T6c]